MAPLNCPRIPTKDMWAGDVIDIMWTPHMGRSKDQGSVLTHT